MFVWGKNDQGQLGLGGNNRESKIIPTPILSLRALPISQIFSGANHSGVLTASGAIFVWGRNAWGQLGTGDQLEISAPLLLKTIRDQQVEFVSMGEGKYQNAV